MSRTYIDELLSKIDVSLILLVVDWPTVKFQSEYSGDGRNAEQWIAEWMLKLPKGTKGVILDKANIRPNFHFTAPADAYEEKTRA